MGTDLTGALCMPQMNARHVRSKRISPRGGERVPAVQGKCKFDSTHNLMLTQNGGLTLKNFAFSQPHAATLRGFRIAPQACGSHPASHPQYPVPNTQYPTPPTQQNHLYQHKQICPIQDWDHLT